jgi:hypothetical protein
MAVKETHFSSLSGHPIFFGCNIVTHFVNSLFVFQPRGDHKLKNTHWSIFAFCWSVCGSNCFTLREPQMSLYLYKNSCIVLYLLGYGDFLYM